MSRLLILLALAVSAQDGPKIGFSNKAGALLVKVPTDPAQCLALTTSRILAYSQEVESRGQKYIVTFRSGKIDIEPMGKPPRRVDWHEVFDFVVIVGFTIAMCHLIATWPWRRR